MRRALFTLVAAAALCMWAGAQGPPPALTAADQVKLLKTNRVLIGDLVDHGLALANAGDPLDRAEACRATARSLANALQRAAGDEDPDRVAELAGLMTDVVRDGLAPNLAEAKRTIPPGSPREPQLVKVCENATADLDDVRAAVPSGGKLADHEKVKKALDALAALKSSVK